MDIMQNAARIAKKIRERSGPEALSAGIVLGSGWNGVEDKGIGEVITAVCMSNVIGRPGGHGTGDYIYAAEKYVEKFKDYPKTPDFASIDVSFISLKIILPVLHSILSDNGVCVCLVKPQFEAGREHVGKKGVVRDEQVHTDVLRGIAEFAFASGYSVLGAAFSPIRGPEGNIEYLLHLSKADAPVFAEIPYAQLVRLSHESLT